MFSKFLKTFLAVLLILFCGELRGQNGIAKHHDRLREIRDEINRVEKEIKTNEKKESSELYRLSNLDLEIDMTQSIIRNLKTEQKQKEKEIARIEHDLETTKKELEQLKKLFSKRLVHIYKYGRMKDLELLLTARSLNDGLLWIEYQKRLSEHDYRNYVKIKEKQAEIARNRDLLTIELREKKKLLGKKVQKEQKLKRDKSKRQKILISIRHNTSLLRDQLAEKEKAAEEIRKLIFQLEQSPEEQPLLPPQTLFADLHGRMPWPTTGKIVTRFGKYKHPELKTVTENIGIEIEAQLGSLVKAVASGKVTAITWQRGRGTIVIVSHYGGYYSVYTHLEEIRVDLLEQVEMGQVIGTVGESGSIKGPILHFEIWKGTEKLDPEDWLAKNT